MGRTVDIIQELLLLIDAVRDRDEISRLVVLKGLLRSKNSVNPSLRVIDKPRSRRIWRSCLGCKTLQSTR